MTKKEQAAFDALKHELRLAKALSWTGPLIEPDLPPPAYDAGKTFGYNINIFSDRIVATWSSFIYHGQHDPLEDPAQKSLRSRSQGPRALYSNPLLASTALRRVVERECAERLAKIDKQIEDAVETLNKPDTTA